MRNELQVGDLPRHDEDIAPLGHAGTGNFAKNDRIDSSKDVLLRRA
jgi:hypothetical protein